MNPEILSDSFCFMKLILTMGAILIQPHPRAKGGTWGTPTGGMRSHITPTQNNAEGLAYNNSGGHGAGPNVCDARCRTVPTRRQGQPS